MPPRALVPCSAMDQNATQSKRPMHPFRQGGPWGKSVAESLRPRGQQTSGQAMRLLYARPPAMRWWDAAVDG